MVHRFEDAYDAASIVEDAAPENLVGALASVDLVCSSDLPRAMASAERLGHRRGPVTTPLLREIRIEPPGWIPLPLPIGVWDMFSHLQWSYRLLARSEHEFVRRAREAAAWIEEQSARSPNILAVTHAGFRRLLAAKLTDRGWEYAPGKRSYENWSVWELRRDR